MKKISPSTFVNDFLNTFQALSKFQQKCFKYLQWFAKKFRCVFPCIQKIANAIGCSIATIKRATAYFQNIGWLYKRKRGYQSSLYYLHQELIDLDLNDQSLFLRDKCAENELVLRSSFPDSNEFISTSEKVPISNEMKNREIPESIKLVGLDHKERQDLANMFSHFELDKAVDDALSYDSWGNNIKSWFAVIFSRAKNYKLNRQ